MNASNQPLGLVFLPGAAGNDRLWKPVSDALPLLGRRRFHRWPGFAGEPHDPSVTSLSDLVDRVVAEIHEPVALLAQSMGGIIALRATLRRPEQVRSLVLSVTSGGVDVRRLGAIDWRPRFQTNHPDTPRWFLDAQDDLTDQLCAIDVPVLLLWGDADPISPVAVGQHLAKLLPRAELVVIPGGTHDLVAECASDVAPRIQRHLDRS